MKDYRFLSEWEKEKVDRLITDQIEPKHHINERNGFEWDEPESTRIAVHNGHKCAECLMIYYNCLCGHD